MVVLVGSVGQAAARSRARSHILPISASTAAKARRSARGIGSAGGPMAAQPGRRMYVRFLDIAFGSARELEYQLSLARRLGFGSEADHVQVKKKAVETCKVLGGLIRSLTR